MNKTTATIILSLVCAASYQALGDEIEVKSLNRSSTGFFVFSPEFPRIKPGDAVNFVTTDKGHQVYSVPGMIPEGAQPLDAKMSPRHQGNVHRARGLCDRLQAAHVYGHDQCRPRRRPNKYRQPRPQQPSGQRPDQTRNLARTAQEKLSNGRGPTRR